MVGLTLEWWFQKIGVFVTLFGKFSDSAFFFFSGCIVGVSFQLLPTCLLMLVESIVLHVLGNLLSRWAEKNSSSSDSCIFYSSPYLIFVFLYFCIFVQITVTKIPKVTDNWLYIFMTSHNHNNFNFKILVIFLKFIMLNRWHLKIVQLPLWLEHIYNNMIILFLVWSAFCFLLIVRFKKLTLVKDYSIYFFLDIQVQKQKIWSYYLRYQEPQFSIRS